MVLENIDYVPTLAIRASEMNGLEFLPGATKDRMLPCFLLAPWANSLTLARAIVRLERAFPNRPYFLDIDYDYDISNTESGPQQELIQLKNPNGDYQNWVNFVSDRENIIPALQTRGLNSNAIVRQISQFQMQGKPYCVRIVKDRFPDNLNEIISAVSNSGSADFAIILEGGWTQDPLTLSAWFNGIISNTLQEIDVNIPIVISCTSSPKIFTEFNSSRPVEVQFNNRQLVSQVSRNNNRARVVYGDWGSTRPREDSGFSSRPIDRVDYPATGSWYIARNKDLRWSFRDAAQAIVRENFWDGGLGIWGEEMISNTTVNEELGIHSPQKNVAARVNIHLHLQAFFGQGPISPASFDEEWVD